MENDFISQSSQPLQDLDSKDPHVHIGPYFLLWHFVANSGIC